MNIQQHIAEQERLLQMEYDYERQEYEAMCRRVGIARRIRQGRCWYPIVAGRTFYNALDQLVIELTAPDSLDISDHEFEPGRPVVFFTTDNRHPDDDAAATSSDDAATHFLPYACQVSRLDGRRMHVTISGARVASDLRQSSLDGCLGIQLSFDATSHRVMRDAIAALRTTDDERLLHMAKVLIGNGRPSFRATQPVVFPWLNPSQQRAVHKVLEAREVAIVHGPPGTGKTTTLVEAIGETLMRETQVLVCAQSNAAVDWIAEQLAARGISVLRIGNPVRVSDALLAATYERRYADHPDYAELWGIRRTLRELRQQIGARSVSGSRRAQLGNQMNRLKHRKTELEIRINADLFDQSRVVACTLIGTSARVLERRRFSTLFIDEAAQAFEAACWAAIEKADRVILAGDHCQLPPTVKCREAELSGLGHTLMQRVAADKPECVELLTVQYRMHRDIMQFSSEWFYNGQLSAAPECATRTITPLDTPLVWVDTSRLGLEEEQNPLSQSRLNTAEAQLLIATLVEYVRTLTPERIVDERIDFGIISPYKSQVMVLRRLVRENADLRPLQRHISINTVDGFQGQERDVVLLSMVRGNDEGRIGFLGDLRRMNVAITRARMKLIVVGDTTTLARTRFYRRLTEHVERHGQLIVLRPDAPTQATEVPQSDI